MKSKANIESMLLYAVVVLVCMGGSAFGRIIYVDDDASGIDIGTSWYNALDSLQDALLLSYFYDKPVEIRVAGGVYTPDKGIGIAEGDRDASFQLIEGVTVKGGYAGLELRGDVDIRDIELYQTILSGDLGRNSESSIAGRADNSCHVVTCSGTDDTAVLDGVTITAGRGDSTDSGGGFYNSSGCPILRNCTITGNIGYDGAGVYNWIGNPMFVNCTFSENTADEYGAAIYNNRGTPNLLSCVFTGNSADQGAGIYNDNGDLAITDCTFSENTGESGGAIYNFGGTSMMADCDFIANSTTQVGGAVYNYGDISTFLNCMFMENSTSGSGGGIFNSIIVGSRANLTNCIFCRNSARNGGAVGFATYGIGEFYNTDGNVYMLNCTLIGNVADRAGGAISADVMRRYGNSFFGDDLTDSYRIILDSCILWDNTPDEINDDSDEDVTIKYSNVQGGFVGEGNIDIEPLFADPNNDDYHLQSAAGRWDPAISGWVIDQSSSPCIDTGDPNVPVGLERFPNGGRINMGAYGGTSQASLTPSQLPILYGKAYNPDPADGTYGVNDDVTLSWTAGLNSEFHDVYFGTDEEAVATADKSDTTGVFRGRQSATTFDPSEGDTLDSGLYYWRIDEISSEGEIVTGDIWSFRVGATKGRACFIGGTKVWIDDALVPISQAITAQLVSGICGENKIERVQAHSGAFTCYDIVLESGKNITVAENHYFMTVSGKWLSLKELKNGTRLKTSKGSIEIKSITKQPLLYTGKVYNLKIEGSDQYMVGEDAIIVRDY